MSSRVLVEEPASVSLSAYGKARVHGAKERR